MGFGPLMTVDGMGGGAESDTTGEGTTVNSSLLCEVEPSEVGRGTGRVAVTGQSSFLRAIRDRNFHELSFPLISENLATTLSIVGRFVGSS